MICNLKYYIFVSFIPLLLSCASLNIDEDKSKECSVIPQNTAKRIIAKYVDQEWIDNPYVPMITEILDEKGFTSKTIRGKEYISYRDMTIHPDLVGDKCIFMSRCGQSLSCGDYVDSDNVLHTLKGNKKIIFYSQKICTRFKAERDELVCALIALGSDFRH